LKSAGRGLTADRERQGVRRTLVVSQVALSLVLLVGALLFVGTFRNLLTVETGFRQDGIIVANLDLRRMKLPPERRAPVRREIVGVVKDTKYRRLREDFGPIAFLPSSQQPRTGQYLRLLVRSAAAANATISAIDRALSRDYPAITFNFSVLKAQIRESLLRERLMATLSGFFGALAMLLATIGLYGVMSYMVVRRRNEIGIRMALGAARRDVMTMIMREAAVLVGMGLAIGAVIAIALAHTAAALLFGVRPGDPVSLLLGIASLAAVAALASYLPAQRAARLEPTIALREE